MATVQAPPGPPPGLAIARSQREHTGGWPLVDRIAYALCWIVGVGLCLIAVGIVLFMLVKGVSYLKPSLLFEHPSSSVKQSESGGFLDPIEGTMILTVLGMLIAAPVGVALATWLCEYARPTWLARAVDSAIEVISGVPSVVLALFALLISTQGSLGFLSTTAENGAVFGKSYFVASAAMAVLALPLVVASAREGLNQLPSRLREASYALGRTRITTIRRVLLPAVKPDIASGIVLGMGRIIGDTAIVILVLGETATIQGIGSVPVIGTLRGTGSTLTSYVFTNSPAGEGGSPQKAYAAAFVLLLIVLGLNAIVTVIAGGSSSADGPGRLRRIFDLRRLLWTR